MAGTGDASLALLPLASLTLSSPAAISTRNTAASTSISSSARPAAVPRRAATSADLQQQTAASFSTPTRQQRKQQQQTKPRHHQAARRRAWALPLAAAAAGLTLRAAGAAAHHLNKLPAAPMGRALRAAAARVLPGLLPRRLRGGRSGPPGLPSGRKPALLWFRNDLRLHDHEALAAACAGSTSVLPVYVFDPREYGKSRSGFDKTGPYRASFILQALSDLRARLRDAGSDLVVRVGRPETVLPRLARAVGAGAVYCHGEVTEADARVEASVAAGLDGCGAALRVLWGGSTLFHVDDLPFELGAMPPHYSEFRAAVSRLAVRAPVELPAAGVKGLPAASVPLGELPSMQELGFDAATLTRCAADASAGGANLRGGESEALRRLRDFVTHFAAAASSGGGAAGSGSNGSATASAPADGSSFCCKISPWLALGCLSPRQLFGQLQQRLGSGGQQAVAERGADADLQWLLYELLWRDFFRFVTQKYTLAAAGAAGGSAAAAPAQGQQQQLAFA